jgi:hypothetical protein
MKKLIAALNLLMLSTVASAAGPMDGIYSCGVNIFGANYASYITVNGNAEGGTIFAVAAVSPSQTFYGYGIGSATATSFTGSTMFGAPFSLSYRSATGSMSGTIGILWGGNTVNANASCQKIW